MNTQRLDCIGAAASLVCALHCAAMPLLILMLPWLRASFVASHLTEWILVLSTICLAALSVRAGWRIHRSLSALAVLAAGIILLLTGRICEECNLGVVGVPLLVLGGFMLMSAHLLNRRLCRACPLCVREA